MFNVLNVTHYGNPQFNGAGGNTPFGTPTAFGASAATPDVSNNNPALGSGGPREFQACCGFRLSLGRAVLLAGGAGLQPRPSTSRNTI